MKNIIILTFFLILFQISQIKAHDPTTYAFMALNSPISIQQGFGTKAPVYRIAADLNLNLFFLLNIGINYQDYYGLNSYIGLGIGSLIQVQYGYGFTQHKDLFRVRSDMPLFLFVDRNSFVRFFSIGIYYEQTKNDEKKGNTFGITTGISIASIINEIVNE